MGLRIRNKGLLQNLSHLFPFPFSLLPFSHSSPLIYVAKESSFTRALSIKKVRLLTNLKIVLCFASYLGTITV